MLDVDAEGSEWHEVSRVVLHIDPEREHAQQISRAGQWHAMQAHRARRCLGVPPTIAEAMNNLGDIYTSGRGLPREYAQAMSWYRKAAVRNRHAANSPGVMY